jgi:diacylglycerol kinase
MEKFLRSFTYAWKGLRYAFRTQLNFKVHSLAGLAAICLGISLNISRQDWLWIFLAIALMLVAELFNTAIEVLVDFISPAYHPKAGIVKDVSAAAVLIIAFLAIIIGLMVFVPKLL